MNPKVFLRFCEMASDMVTLKTVWQWENTSSSLLKGLPSVNREECDEKNLLLYLSARPYFLCPVFISPLALTRTPPFLSHSFSLLCLCPKIPNSVREDLPLGLQDASAPPLHLAPAQPRPRDQPPTGTSQGWDPKSNPKASTSELHFPEEPRVRLTPSPTPTSAPTVASLGLDQRAPYASTAASPPDPTRTSAPTTKSDSYPASPPPAHRPPTAAIPLGPTPPSAPRPRPRSAAAAPSSPQPLRSHPQQPVPATSPASTRAVSTQSRWLP